MAIAYARPHPISRAAGRSAVAAAAYRAGARLEDERQGKTHDYARRGGVLASGILTPEDAPEWMRDRAQLWNAVERREDRSTRRDEAQLAREIVLALPHELDDRSREYLVKNILKETATRQGMVADYAIHAPGKEGDDRNYHAHVMLTMRRIDAHDPDGFGKKERAWNSKQELERFKAIVERETNRMLARHGIEERISFVREGMEPTKHMGHQATQLERRGKATDIGAENRAIRERNRERGALPELAAELRDVTAERESLERGARREAAAEMTQPFPKTAGLRGAASMAGRAADALGNAAEGFLAGLTDFVLGADPREQARLDYLDTPEGRMELLRQREAEEERKAALDRMREDRDAGRGIDTREFAHLTRTDLERVKERGEAGLAELLRETERRRDRGRGRERERD